MCFPLNDFFVEKIPITNRSVIWEETFLCYPFFLSWFTLYLTSKSTAPFLFCKATRYSLICKQHFFYMYDSHFSACVWERERRVEDTKLGVHFNHLFTQYYVYGCSYDVWMIEMKWFYQKKARVRWVGLHLRKGILYQVET